MGRWQAYRMIEEAEHGSYFFRFVISPDPQKEDTQQDLFLREITEHTMLALEERFNIHLPWAAVEHTDHAPHRHVHVVAVLPERLQVSDFQAMRQAATERALAQRKERDLIQEQARMHRKEAQWERQR